MRRDKVLVVSIDAMVVDVRHHIPLLREEGFGEKFFTEIGVLTWNKVEDPLAYRVGIQYTPQQAIAELLTEAVIDAGLVHHMSNEEQERLLTAAMDTCYSAYTHFSTLLQRMGMEGEMDVEIFVEDWLGDTDLLLGVMYR